MAITEKEVPIYHYDPVTFELLNEDVADLDPIEKNPLIPAHATDVMPSATVATGMVQVFDETARKWTETEDHRGTVYAVDGSPVEHDMPGVLPSTLSVTPPPGAHHTWDGTAWLFDFVSALDAKKMEISTAYEQAVFVIRGAYSQTEMDTWNKQEAEARAVIADPASITPLLSAIATARGLSVAVIAASIIAKADAYAASAGTILGKRLALDDALAVIAADPTLAADPALAQVEIDKVVW